MADEDQVAERCVVDAVGGGAAVDLKNANGNTALMFAVMRDHAEAARRLIAAGADPNARNKRRETPLAVAQAAANERMATLLRIGGR